MLRNIEHIIASLDKPSAEMMALDDASMGTASLPILRASPRGVTHFFARSYPWTSLCFFLTVVCEAVSSLLAVLRGWRASFGEVQSGQKVATRGRVGFSPFRSDLAPDGPVASAD